MSLWFSAQEHKLRFRTWESEQLSIVYNAITGDTHLIDELALQLLKLLITTPRSTKDLTLDLDGLIDESDANKIAEHIESTLLRLQAVGLVNHQKP